MLYATTLTLIFQNISKYNKYEYLFKLRKVNKKFRNIVESLRYCQIFNNRILDYFKKIRKTFKKALHVNISYNRKITDKDFKYLKGIYSLDISYCYQKTITDKAFENLHGIHTLNMSNCCQETITDKAFENLKGIHTLNISMCDQKTITAKAFENLKGIHTLIMNECYQNTITNKFLENLKGIKKLNINNNTFILNDTDFKNLKGIHTLYMCNRSNITDKAFKYLKGGCKGWVYTN